MQSTGRMRDFRDAVEREIIELVRLEIITSGCIEISSRGTEQLAVWLPPRDE